MFLTFRCFHLLTCLIYSYMFTVAFLFYIAPMFTCGSFFYILLQVCNCYLSSCYSRHSQLPFFFIIFCVSWIVNFFCIMLHVHSCSLLVHYSTCSHLVCLFTSFSCSLLLFYLKLFYMLTIAILFDIVPQVNCCYICSYHSACSMKIHCTW